MTVNTTELTRRKDLSDVVDTIGWGLLFVAIGAVSLVPAMPEGAWLVAAGVVILGACAVRAWLQLGVHGVTAVVGIVALVAGILTVAGFSGEVGPVVLIVLGLTLVVGALYRTQRSDVAPFASTH